MDGDFTENEIRGDLQKSFDGAFRHFSRWNQERLLP